MRLLGKNIKLESKIAFSLPQGKISKPGRDLVNAYALEQGWPELPEDWEWNWRVGGRGVYVGTFPKRVAKYLYKQGTKAQKEQLTALGNIAQAHTHQEEQVIFDFTDKFNWRSGDFADGDSCFWSGRSNAKKSMEQDGYLAMRFFSARGSGIGRAWLRPDNGETPFLIAFNGYGYQLSTAARILATWLGAYYHRTELYNFDRTGGVLFINGGVGYTIGEYTHIRQIHKIDLQMTSVMYECKGCGGHTHNPGRTVIGPRGGKRRLCDTCLSSGHHRCLYCSGYMKKEHGYGTSSKGYICYHCREYLTKCNGCKLYIMGTVHEKGKKCYCETCASKWLSRCYSCRNLVEKTVKRKLSGKLRKLCDRCAMMRVECEECGDRFIREMFDGNVCRKSSCREAKRRRRASARAESGWHTYAVPDVEPGRWQEVGLYDRRLYNPYITNEPIADEPIAAPDPVRYDRLPITPTHQVAPDDRLDNRPGQPDEIPDGWVTYGGDLIRGTFSGLRDQVDERPADTADTQPDTQPDDQRDVVVDENAVVVDEDTWQLLTDRLRDISARLTNNEGERDASEDGGITWAAYDGILDE